MDTVGWMHIHTRTQTHTVWNVKKSRIWDKMGAWDVGRFERKLSIELCKYSSHKEKYYINIPKPWFIALRNI